MSRYDTEALSQAFGVSAEAFAQIRRLRPTSCRAKCCRWMVRSAFRRELDRAEPTAMP